MASKPSVGYLGMGIMGTAMAGRLADAGYPLTVWNRTASRCDPLKEKGAKVAATPREVIETCDLVFACTSDPESARAVVFGENGVLAGITAGKKFIDMSTVDEETSKEIGQAVRSKGGLFVEGPVSGSKGPAIEGKLVILAAGDEALKNEAQPCFDIMGKKTFFLGDVGCGARMKLVVNMMMGINMVALSEGLAMGQKAGLKGEDILEVIGQGAITSPMYSMKGPKMLKGEFDPAFPLKHQQKDVRLAVDLGGKVGQPLPLAAAANEVLKAGMADGKGDLDFSAVYEAVRR